MQAAIRAFTGAPPSEAGATGGIGGAGAGAALGSVPRVLALVANLEVRYVGNNRMSIPFACNHAHTISQSYCAAHK